MRAIATGATRRWMGEPELLSLATDPLRLPRRDPALAGLIVFLSNLAWRKRVAQLGVPWVNTSNRLPPRPGEFRVVHDDLEVGRQQARWLLRSGYRHLCFAAQSDSHFSALREQGFREQAAEAGVAVTTLPLNEWFDSNPIRSIQRRETEISALLRATPGSLGIAAVNDVYAEWVLRQLATVDPDRLWTTGIIGVDGLQLPAEQPPDLPSWASIRLDFERLGTLAAETLLRLLRPGSVRAPLPAIAPAGIVPGASGSGPACADPIVARARAIAYHSLEVGMIPTIGELARRVGTSTRTLLRRFDRELGHGPVAELRRLRLARAQHLLRTGRQSIGEVAQACGFATHSDFSHAFRLATGQSPRLWRQQSRVGIPPCR